MLGLETGAATTCYIKRKVNRQECFVWWKIWLQCIDLVGLLELHSERNIFKCFVLTEGNILLLPPLHYWIGKKPHLTTFSVSGKNTRLFPGSWPEKERELPESMLAKEF